MLIREKYVFDCLKHFAATTPDLSLRRVRDLLKVLWDCEDVEFLDQEAETAMGGKTFISNVLAKPFVIRVTADLSIDPTDDSASHPVTSQEPQALRTLKDPHPASTGINDLPPEYLQPRPRSIDPLIERAIAAIDLQERRRDFIWAGFIVKDMLPGMGIETREAQLLFDQMVDTGMLLLEKRANPNNPDFPSTCVKLNRDDKVVRAVLGRNGDAPKAFQPVPIRGELASATLIRDRR